MPRKAARPGPRPSRRSTRFHVPLVKQFVKESMAAGLDVAGDAIVDSLELALLAGQLWSLLPATVHADDWAGDTDAEAVCIVETATVCAAKSSSSQFG